MEEDWQASISGWFSVSVLMLEEHPKLALCGELGGCDKTSWHHHHHQWNTITSSQGACLQHCGGAIQESREKKCSWAWFSGVSSRSWSATVNWVAVGLHVMNVSRYSELGSLKGPFITIMDYWNHLDEWTEREGAHCLRWSPCRQLSEWFPLIVSMWSVGDFPNKAAQQHCVNIRRLAEMREWLISERYHMLGWVVFQMKAAPRRLRSTSTGQTELLGTASSTSWETCFP